MSHLLRRTVTVSTLSGRGGLIARSGRSLMVSSSASYSGAAASTARRWINIGVIAAASAGLAYAVKESEVVEAAGVENGGINSKAFTPLTLKDRKHVTHNTDLFIFALKDKDAHLNLPVSSYIVTKYKGEDGKDVIRPYTPINHNEPGELHLLVKTYPRGLMSKHIHQLKVGDQLEIKGPLPKFDYHANQKKDVAFVVGGTGITPCLQVLEAILENPQDKTNVSIVFANTSTADILLKDRIDAAAASRKNVKVTYVIDKPEPGFHGETGYLNAEMLKKYLPKPSKDTMVFACGPPPFMNAVSGPKTPDYKQGEVTGALKELGFDSSNVFKF